MQLKHRWHVMAMGMTFTRPSPLGASGKLLATQHCVSMAAGVHLIELWMQGGNGVGEGARV